MENDGGMLNKTNRAKQILLIALLLFSICTSAAGDYGTLNTSNDLRITKLTAAPPRLEKGKTFLSVSVEVKNFSAAQHDVFVLLAAADQLTGAPLQPAPIESVKIQCPNVGVPVGAGAICSLDQTKFTAFLDNLKGLPYGSYQLVALAYKDNTLPGTLPDDRADLLFSVGGSNSSVPETDFALLPLVALSALAVLFFAGRKK